MHPVLFEVFGRQIGTYSLFMILGAVAAWFTIKVLGKRKDADISLIFLFCICGGLVGAFLLRPITRIPEILMNWEQLRHLPPDVFASMVFGEVVFYGGFIGGVIALLLYCRKYKVPVRPVVDLFAPALAIAHAFGRVGCFFGGCCYGAPVSSSHPFSVVFPPFPIAAPAGVPLLATQLIEATCLLVIAIILAVVYKKTAGTGLTACLYGLLYSILRFFLEFYRGDPVRGIYGPFSTSQYISIVLFATSVILLVLLLKKRRQNHPLDLNDK